MISTLRSILRVVTGGLLLASCSLPPPGAITGGARTDAEALELGGNSAGESCSLQRGPSDANIYCGIYLEPSGRVVTASGGDPVSLLAASPWRTAFDNRFACGVPSGTAVLDGSGAAMTCIHRHRGYKQVVMAARIGDAVYIADAIEPAVPVLPRAIGVMANRLPAVPVKAEQAALRSRREATRQTDITGAAALQAIDQLTADGARENREGNYAAAEADYRRVVEVQEKLVGPNNPALAVPLARQAVQVSNQGRFAESERLLARANKLATLPSQPDPAALPLTIHLTALDKLNRDQPAEALTLLTQAESGFRHLVPKGVLTGRPRTDAVARSTAEQMSTYAEDAALLSNQSTNDALHGLLETYRYRAIALRGLGRGAEADAVLNTARTMFAGRDPRLAARYFRTAGMGAASSGRGTAAVADLENAVTYFGQGDTNRPLAETQLLLASQLIAQGESRRAASRCQDAVKTLQTLKIGLPIDKVMPCLSALYATSGQSIGIGGSPATDMFALAQIAQGGITSRQIAQATAALGAGSKNAAVRKAIQQQDALKPALDDLYRKRAELASDKADATKLSIIDDKIKRLEEERQEAGTALQAAAPGYAALIQESVSVRDVQNLLRPGEALAVIVVGDRDGYTLLVRDGRIYTGRIDGGSGRVDALVQRFRSSMAVQPGAPPLPFDTEAARELFTAVLGPVENGLAGVTSLVVAPTGSLLSVPFGALLTGPAANPNLGQAPFLVRRMAVAHVPSPSSFVNLRQGSRNGGQGASPARRTVAEAGRPWFGFGGFRAPSQNQAAATFPSDTCGASARLFASLPPLPGSGQELDVARKLTGAAENEQLLGPAFTARGVTSLTQLADYRVLHFSTHALLPGELRCQTEPAIVTSTPPNARDASGALLKTSDIQELQLNADLVILSACNTGGPNGAGAGESLSGLARSFFFAGARTLMVTHWESNNVTLPYLMARFLKNAKSATGGDYAAALAMAQRTMLDEAVGDLVLQSHPYYWAVAAVVGGTGRARP